MTSNDRMEILRRAVEEHGQAEVARRIGRAPSGINQILKGTYNADPARVLELVEAEFGENEVDCPELGEIPLATCLEERDKPFRATSSQRVRLFRACQICKNKGGTK